MPTEPTSIPLWAALLGYLIGSIPFGLLLTRAAGLGGMAHIYLRPGLARDRGALIDAMRVLREAPGTHAVMDRETAATSLKLPAESIGDLVVLADLDSVLAGEPPAADAPVLQRKNLRSTGSIYETNVPMIVGRELTDVRATSLTRGQYFTSDAFDLLLNDASDADTTERAWM